MAKQIVIEKEAHLCLHFPLYTEELIVYGKLIATIYCRGMVHIHKKGFLEGPVWARGIEVSRHGHYSGNLQIQDKVEEIPAPSYFVSNSS
jgi:cytoskeletal protein CcmA (bactofilin family)